VKRSAGFAIQRIHFGPVTQKRFYTPQPAVRRRNVQGLLAVSGHCPDVDAQVQHGSQGLFMAVSSGAVDGCKTVPIQTTAIGVGSQQEADSFDTTVQRRVVERRPPTPIPFRRVAVVSQEPLDGFPVVASRSKVQWGLSMTVLHLKLSAMAHQAFHHLDMPTHRR